MTDKNRMYICKICQQTWRELPEGATQLQKGSGPGYTMFRFADGSVHNIRSMKARSAEEQS